jgi:hypothetical protein
MIADVKITARRDCLAEEVKIKKGSIHVSFLYVDVSLVFERLTCFRITSSHKVK